MEAAATPVPFKVLPPSLPEPYIARPQLERRLDAAARRRLTLVIADTGLGKSTALAAWASHRRSAWYTLDAGDRTLPVLLTGLQDA
jgi:LuxR family transcriptional regulator, maltose regulon positive regulatory protein